VKLATRIFFKESEKLSLEELQSLTSLLIEWTKSSALQRGNLPKKIKRLHRRPFG
jgi:hypothetical protein